MQAPEVSKNARLLDIIDFALRSEEHASLPKTSVISIRELSKNKDCVQQLIQRGLVQVHSCARVPWFANVSGKMILLLWFAYVSEKLIRLL